MLSFYLQKALNDLESLIKISQADIDDIRLAEHTAQFERMKLKEETLRSFENKKAMIDHEISKLMTAHPEKGMAELLDHEQGEQLQQLKNRLSELREINKKYAKMVLGVSAFYNALLERVVPTEMHGYHKVASSKNASFLEVRA